MLSAASLVARRNFSPENRFRRVRFRLLVWWLVLGPWCQRVARSTPRDQFLKICSQKAFILKKIRISNPVLRIYKILSQDTNHFWILRFALIFLSALWPPRQAPRQTYPQSCETLLMCKRGWSILQQLLASTRVFSSTNASVPTSVWLEPAYMSALSSIWNANICCEENFLHALVSFFSSHLLSCLSQISPEITRNSELIEHVYTGSNNSQIIRMEWKWNNDQGGSTTSLR